MLFLNHSRDTVIKDQAGAMLYEEFLKDKGLGKDIMHNQNATRE
jgi:hypothetical protein